MTNSQASRQESSAQTPNLPAPRSLAKNFFALAAASGFTKLVNLFVVAYVARTLQAAGYGQLSFATAIAGYFALLTGLGLESYAVREVARQPESVRRLVGQITALKLVTVLVAALLLSISVFVIPKATVVKELMVFSFISLSISMFRINWVYTGLERLQWVAVATVLEQLANAVLVVLFVRAPEHLLRIPLVAAAAFVLSGAWLYVLYVREFGGMSLAFDQAAWRTMLRESLPMGVSTVLGALYYNFDTIMLSFMRSDQEVGWYNAAYKLIMAIVAFRFIMISAVYPRASRLYVESQERLAALISRLQRLTIIVLVPMGVGGTVLAANIIRVLYGPAYAPATVPLQILIWSSVLFLGNAIFPVLLYAANRQADETRALLAAVGLNIALNCVLIPRYGIVGAAWATIAADVLMVCWLYNRSRKVMHIELLPMVTAPCVSAAIMAAIVFWIRDRSLLISIPVGVAVYSACLFALRGLTPNDLRFLREFLPKSQLSR